MKYPIYNLNFRRRIFPAFVFLAALTAAGLFINHSTLAGAVSDASSDREKTSGTTQLSAASGSAPVANIEERTSVWLKLQKGESPETVFRGDERPVSALRNGFAEPLAQVAADFNADGYADLVGGFRNAAGGGLIVIHRASREAFAPEDAGVLENLKKSVFPAAFDKDALVTEVAGAPDFIVAGKFTRDSATDLVFASRGGRVIYLMTSDNKGGFSPPKEIAVAGEITALASKRLNYDGPFDGIVAAVTDGNSSSLLVFSSDSDLMNAVPRVIQTESPVGSIVLAEREPGSPDPKLFGLADGKLFTVSGVAGANYKFNAVELPYRAVDFAVGNFIADRRSRNEIAVLTENGSVNYLTDGKIDMSPLSAEETNRNLRKYGRKAIPFKPDYSPDSWTEKESYRLGVYAAEPGAVGLLRKAYLSGYETEDLMIVDQAAKRVEILFKEPNRDENRTSFTGETKTQIVDFDRAPVSVLPMRLNVMGQQGFVVYDQGTIEPAALMVAPNATFTVSKAADTSDGACNADCSIREAVIASNSAAGSDMISVPSNTYTLTRTGIENAAASGDLDILDAVTIVGAGSAATIIQAGTSAGTGIDKIYSVNPDLLTNLSFATSMTNMTMRFGRSTEGVGGAMDWDAGSTGTITLNNVTATGNNVTGFAGGGAYLFSNVNNPGAGSVTITNSTVSNNTTDGNGGGIVMQNVPFSMTTVTVSGNSSALPGGGLFIDGVVSASSPGSSIFTGVSFTGNSVTGAARDGGGIFTLRGLVFNAPTLINNNSSTRWGGGIYMDVNGSSVNLNKVTLTGNSAATNGGAVTVGTVAGNTLNMSFSRIVGNTSGGTIKGLSLRGGTANAVNNWWGCNTGPSAAPCDTAGVDLSGGAPGGTLNTSPYLRYTHTASPSTIVVGQSATLTASFLTNSAGTAIAASNLDVLFGLPATFNNAVRGTITGSPTTVQNSGTATATFTGTAVGAGSANAAIDNGSATAALTVAQAATTTTITNDSPDPSVRGQAITVTYTVTVNAPGAGTPTGNVTVSDGVNSCTATVAAGQCSLTLNTVGARTLTASYAGDANFAGSSDTEPHQVNPAGTSTTITGESRDPTPQGQSFIVTYTVTVNAPGAGTPTGNVTVSDGVNSCTATVAAGQCSLTLNTVGLRTLTATYAGDTNSAGSVSPGVPHTVVPVTAAPVTVGGQVRDRNGRGIPGAVVTLNGQDGLPLNVRTNSFGYYRFAEVIVRRTYMMGVRHKNYSFSPRVITVNEDLQETNFTSLD